MRRIVVTEGVPFVEPEFADLIRQAGDRIWTQLRPRFRPVTEEAGQFTVRNVIGTIWVNDSTVLEVEPKVGADEDWTHAVLDLLLWPDRIDIAGSRLSGFAPRRPELLEVLASAYATRLQRALHRDGPLLLIHRRADSLRVFKGKLNATLYVRRMGWKPQIFSVSYDLLSADSDFSRAMAVVARLLASATSSARVRSSLLESAVALRPGFAEEVRIDPIVVARPFPEQWGVYKPAWSITVAILSKTSLLRARGPHHGVEVAIEAWPLLERLLQRALEDAVRQARAAGFNVARVPKRKTSLLVSPTEGGSPRGVEPDGQLVKNGATIATFEAKYSPVATAGSWPREDHVFQALATAAACDSPLAVLVYPEAFKPVWWNVQGFKGRPQQLAAVGLGLFSYRRGEGDRTRGEMIQTLLNGRPPQQTPRDVA